MDLKKKKKRIMQSYSRGENKNIELEISFLCHINLVTNITQALTQPAMILKSCLHTDASVLII